MLRHLHGWRVGIMEPLFAIGLILIAFALAASEERA